MSNSNKNLSINTIRFSLPWSTYEKVINVTISCILTSPICNNVGKYQGHPRCTIREDYISFRMQMIANGGFVSPV